MKEKEKDKDKDKEIFLFFSFPTTNQPTTYVKEWVRNTMHTQDQIKEEHNNQNLHDHQHNEEQK